MVQRFFRSAPVTLGLTLRWIGLLLAVVLTAAALFLWSQQVRMESALRYTCDLAVFTKITEECVEEVPIPVNRQFDAVTDRPGAVGAWTLHPVQKGELLHPAQLTHETPDRFRFEQSGQPLPEGQYGYYVTTPASLLAVVKPGNLLTLELADPAVQQLGTLLDKAPILEKDAGGVFLGLSLNQIAALETLAAEARAQAKEQNPGPQSQPAVLVWTLTQAANPDLPPLYAVPMNLQQFAAPEGGR